MIDLVGILRMHLATNEDILAAADRIEADAIRIAELQSKLEDADLRIATDNVRIDHHKIDNKTLANGLLAEQRKVMELTAELEAARKAPALTPDGVEWIVNDMGELGVKVGNLFVFLYKGYSLEYEDGKHDDETPILWRPVGKREFGETCLPEAWIVRGYRDKRYTKELKYIEGLSDGKPGECDWKPLPTTPQKG